MKKTLLFLALFLIEHPARATLNCNGLTGVGSHDPKPLYHASPVQDLKILEPKVSSHDQKWVYATPYPGIVAAYLGVWSDLDFSQRVDNGEPALVERYAGAFQSIFSGKSGSIYLVSSEGFLFDQTKFKGEAVKAGTASIYDETNITDALAYLHELEAQGKVKLYTYPDRPPTVPSDDSDLIEKGVRWVLRKPESDIYSRFIRFHPGLKERLDQALRQK